MITKAFHHRGLLASVFLLGLSACADQWPEPYVYYSSEYDRENPSFGKDPTDITEVTICYGKRNSTPEDIRQLAQDECGKFRKKAVFIEHKIDQCPLLAPIEAHFTCVGGGYYGGGQEGGNATSGGYSGGRSMKIIGTFSSHPEK